MTRGTTTRTRHARAKSTSPIPRQEVTVTALTAVVGVLVSLPPGTPPSLVVRDGGSTVPYKEAQMADTPTTDFNAAPATETAPLLDAERLDVYRVALQLQVETAGLAIQSYAIRSAGQACPFR